MMDGHEDPTQEGPVPKGDDIYPLIVDSGEDSTVQVGDRNLMVITHLPGNAEASDVPHAEIASSAPGPVSEQTFAPKVVLTGKNAKAQFGKDNRVIINRTTDQGGQVLPSPVSSIQPTTEAVQVSSGLFVQDSSELGVDNPGCSSLPANVFDNSSVHLDEHNQTERKEVSPTTPMELNIPVDEQSDIRDLSGMGQQLDQLQVDMSSPEQCIDTMPRRVAVVAHEIYVFDKKTQTNGDQSEDEEIDNDGELYFEEVRGSYLTQIGPNNMAVSIHIDKAFLEEAKQGGEVTVSPRTGPIITLTWKGVAEAVSSVKTLWSLKFNELMEKMQMEFLKLISHEVFSPLRKKVKYFFKMYKALLTEICYGSVVFVFWHQDEDSAQRMVEEKEGVRKAFQRLMKSIGKGDADFSLEVSIRRHDNTEPKPNISGTEEGRSSEDIPLDINFLAQAVHSRMQQTRDENATRPSPDVEGRLQSMESGIQKMQREVTEQISLTRADMDRNTNEMREVKNMLISIMLQGSQPKSGTDPLSQMLGKYAAKYIPQSTQFPITMEPIIESFKTGQSIRAKNGDELMAQRNENPPDVASEILDESSTPSDGQEKPNSSSMAAKYQSLSAEPVPQDPQGVSRREDSDPSQIKSSKESFQSSTKAYSKKPRSQKVFDEAERLLSSLNVASVGRSTTNKEVKRLANAVAEALIDDDPPPPRAKTMDTLLCLDVSESIGAGGIEDVKRTAIEFVDGIEEIAEQYGLEENLGVIAVGDGARIVQQLTNDYSPVRDAIEALTLGGRTPIFEALTVCIAAIKGRGGVLSVGGSHNIRPRIIFITDGLATNDAYETGPDEPSTDHNTKIQLIRLVSEFSPKEHSSTPNPIVWVPVANADRSFLASLAKLGGGMLVEKNDITTLCSYYRIQENVGKIYICVKHHKGEWANLDAIEAVADALVGDMTPEQKREVVQAVQHKLENKEEKNPDSDPNDYEHIHEVKDLPPIGTRVIRGPDWKYDDQDTGGPGTVINHAKDENFLWVLWDLNSTVCRYRFGLGGKYDVFQVDDQPRILMQDELIEIGVKVKRGPDWNYGDKDGGQGNMGVVIRKRKDGKVKVRWPNGTIKSCRFGYDGKFDLEMCSIDELIPATQEQSAAQDMPVYQRQEPEIGGHVKPTAEKPHVLWQWKDDLGQWRLYDREQIAKLNKEFDRRPGGSCLLQKHGRDHRVMFREMAEKCLKDGTKRDARRKVVGDEERDELICVEMSLNDGSSWAQ